MKQKIINAFLYAGLTKEEYDEIKPSLSRENRRILSSMSMVALFIFVALVVGAFFNEAMFSRMWMYLGGAITEVVIFILSFRRREQSHLVTLLLMYLFDLILWGFGFAMDIFTRYDGAAVSFVAMLVICQLVFNDRPLRSGAMAMAAGAVFLIVADKVKTNAAMLEDVLNVTSFVAAGWALNVLMMSARAGNHLKTLEQQRQKEALQEALRAADEANSAKSTFLFNVSHDIRTPMNAILGYAELLNRAVPQSEMKQHEYIDKLRDSGRYMMDILDNVLEMAKIESGKLHIEEATCRVDDFLVSLAAVFESELRRKKLNFTTAANVEHHCVVSDDLKMREVMLNIISNSVKYTPEGGSISMIVDELPNDKPGFCTLRCTITDTGIGISKEFLPHLFDVFSRDRSAIESQAAGTGLGMGIVKKYVDMMGGTIEVESEVGKGTSTVITIEHRIAPESSVKKKKIGSSCSENHESTLQGKRVLLAEDNDLNAEIAAELLGEYGIITERAEDGSVCINMLEKAEPGYYDLIFMDVRMPNMDGYTAARAIRRLQDPAKAAIPIMAMTANAFEEDREAALAAGMDGHIAKPIDTEKLVELLYNCLVIKK